MHSDIPQPLVSYLTVDTVQANLIHLVPVIKQLRLWSVVGLLPVSHAFHNILNFQQQQQSASQCEVRITAIYWVLSCDNLRQTKREHTKLWIQHANATVIIIRSDSVNVSLKCIFKPELYIFSTIFIFVDCAGQESDYFISELKFTSRSHPVNWRVVVLEDEILT